MPTPTRQVSKRAQTVPKASPGSRRPAPPTGKQVTKTTDDKGRLVLGGKFANRTVIVEMLSETELRVKLARVIPEDEAWLYNNPQALDAVRGGLMDVRAGRLVEGPNLRADQKLAAKLED